jgi:hypothetical protein
VKTAAFALLSLLPACAQSGLESKLQAAAPAGEAWVYYEVPMHAADGSVCGFWNGNISLRQSKLLLDGPQRLRLLFLLHDGKILKTAMASEDCEIVSGAKTLIKVPGITAEESIAFLAARGDDTSLYAISLHQHPAATPRLIALAKDKSDPRRQKKAFFWLAHSKDPAALQYLGDILR